MPQKLLASNKLSVLRHASVEYREQRCDVFVVVSIERHRSKNGTLQDCPQWKNTEKLNPCLAAEEPKRQNTKTQVPGLEKALSLKKRAYSGEEKETVNG